MKRLVLVFTLALVVPKITFSWVKVYGGPEHGYGVQETADGGYIIAGYTQSFGEGGYDIWVLKTNSSGDTVRTRTYGGENSEQCYCIQPTADDSFIIVGMKDGDVWLLKVESNCDTLWTRTFHNEGYDWGQWVEQTSDGGYIIAGNSFEQPWLIKTNADGDSVWSKTYGMMLDKLYCVKQTSDGGYILTGMGYNGETTFDLWLLKTDALGNEQWNRKYGKQGFEQGYSVTQTTDNGYIVAGYGESQGGLLLKTNSQGDTIWTKEYLEGCNFCVQEAKDGGYIITGQGTTLIKTNESGNTLWSRKYIWTGQYVHETSDGGYIITGYDNFSGNLDLCLIKTDSLGDTTTIAITEQPDESPYTWEVVRAVGPEVVLRFSPSGSQGDCVAIFDVSGSKVDELDVPQTGGVVSWGEEHSPGVYFIVADINGNRQTQKVILVR